MNKYNVTRARARLDGSIPASTSILITNTRTQKLADRHESNTTHTHVTLFCIQSLYSAVDDLRDIKADKEQLEIEVKEVHTYMTVCCMITSYSCSTGSLGKIT